MATGTTVDTGDTATTTGTGSTGASRVISAWRFRAGFVWDAPTGMVVNPTTIDGSIGFVSAYSIWLYESGWTAGDDATFCHITIELDGHTGLVDRGASGWTWGLDLPRGPVSSYEDCTARGFDPVQYNLPSGAGFWDAEVYHLRMVVARPRTSRAGSSQAARPRASTPTSGAIC